MTTQTTLEVTKVLFSTSMNKWYLQINRSFEIETTEKHAKYLIDTFNLVETNLFRWELV